MPTVSSVLWRVGAATSLHAALHSSPSPVDFPTILSLFFVHLHASPSEVDLYCCRVECRNVCCRQEDLLYLSPYYVPDCCSLFGASTLAARSGCDSMAWICALQMCTMCIMDRDPARCARRHSLTARVASPGSPIDSARSVAGRSLHCPVVLRAVQRAMMWCSRGICGTAQPSCVELD